MNEKIVILGRSGLVGQNLVARLKAKGYTNMSFSTSIAPISRCSSRFSRILTEYADLAEPGDWQRHFVGAEVVVMLQAQIGGNDYQEFRAQQHRFDATGPRCDQGQQCAVSGSHQFLGRGVGG